MAFPDYMKREREAVSVAFQYGFVSFLSFLIAFTLSVHFSGAGDTAAIGAMWAMISGIVVMQETRKSTLDTAWMRIVGSLAGAVISALYLLVFPFSPLGMAVLIGITVLICGLLGIPGHARLAALTVGAVMVILWVDPGINPVANAATRFPDVIVGSSIAVGVAWVWPFLPFVRAKIT